ncbi:nuclease [Rhodopseudomonas palustris]|uniref:Nuclease n=2 Tax=Nitrobacteraceae TaxID=41294 RepID=A0A0D7ECF3_RHOPL|nr:nuclease [Rhodopseudomonas palustris]
MFAGAMSRAASPCSLAPQGEGQVIAVIDPRGLRLQDGGEVKLVGIEPALPRGDGMAALADLVAGRQVTLRGDSDAPDRYGRQPAFVFLGADADAASAQRQLVGRGAALVGIDIAMGACRAELMAAEASARQRRQGIWADPAAIKNAENPGDILAQIGRFALVEGKVVSVRQAGATVYLNFGRRWTRDFAVTISRRMAGSFEAQGLHLKSLENQHIRVRGWVGVRGGPRIEVRRIEQIEWPGRQ